MICRLLHVGRSVVVMDNGNEHMKRSPVRMSSTRRLFSSPVVLDDDSGSTIQSVVTPVTEAGLDPLMRPALQTPPLSITLTSIDTPSSGLKAILM
jgi:hypothetical protein